MGKTIGVVVSERLSTGLIIDHCLESGLRSFPQDEGDAALVEMHTEGLVRAICEQVVQTSASVKDLSELVAIGVALPGIIKNGVVEDSPNLPQLKGARIAELLAAELRHSNIHALVNVVNDADGMAAGLAAVTGKLDVMIRVWTLGVGIGYGRYPFAPGIWEGGHTVVTLDDKENFCGCGGRGHIEGIMGHRAMRLRFLDMEPEEVFAEGRKEHGELRCRNFVRLWHRALAAGMATNIHMDGPGRFMLSGFNAHFVDLTLLKEYLHQMVKMSPMQSYQIEIVSDSPETRVIGAAVAAEHALSTR